MNMESVLAFLTLSLLLLFNSSVYARKNPAEYWKYVMKDQPMPDAIRGLLRSNPGSLHTPLETQKQEKFNFAFNLQSTAIIYHVHDDEHKEEDKNPMKDFELNSSDSSIDVRPEEKKSFVKDLEPRPNISVYSYGVKQN